MKEKKIIIIGGSIAGCAVGVILQKLNIDFLILEKSSGRISSGSGITLPSSIIKQCISLDMFDNDIPRLVLKNRSMSIKKKETSEVILEHDIEINSLNWVHVYENLKRRILKNRYIKNSEVISIKKIDEKYSVITKNATFDADLIIASDGIDSFVRSSLFPKYKPNYAGYIAWRGVTEGFELLNNKIFEKNVPYYFFLGGHILFYKIPSKDFKLSKKELLNWVMYQDRKDKNLSEILVANDGKIHTKSLPAGKLTNFHIDALEKLTKKSLPVEIQEIVLKTEKPFIQAVFDFMMPHHKNERVIFVGDSATTLRPHTASGVLKALTNAISLYKQCIFNKTENIRDFIDSLGSDQIKINKEESVKAKLLGEALVTCSPNWEEMNKEQAQAWWDNLMEGKNWYATEKTHRFHC